MASRQGLEVTTAHGQLSVVFDTDGSIAFVTYQPSSRTKPRMPRNLDLVSLQKFGASLNDDNAAIAAAPALREIAGEAHQRLVDLAESEPELPEQPELPTEPERATAPEPTGVHAGNGHKPNWPPTAEELLAVIRQIGYSLPALADYYGQRKENVRYHVTEKLIKPGLMKP